MKTKLSFRTYAECIRLYMKKKSVFKLNVGSIEAKEGFINGQGIYAFYSMLLDALTNNVDSEDLDELPDVSNTFISHLKSGETDIHNKFVELAQRDTATKDVENYLTINLIPNIPKESLDTVNDAVMNLINNDDSIGATKQRKFNDNRLNDSPARFHAEVLIFVVQRNQNKIESLTDTKSDKSKDKTVVYALDQLERRMGQTDFQELEAEYENNRNLIFGTPRGRISRQNIQTTLIGEFCCKYSPLMIYGRGGCGKTSLIQSAIMEIHLSVKCKYICFSDIYKLIKNGSISNTDDFLHTYMDVDVLFLDGISEMTPNGFDYSDFITEKICGIIRDICCYYNDIRLIITGCFSNKKEASAVTDLISPGFHLVEIKGILEDEHIRMICNEKGRTFSELVKRPLYYNTYKALNIESVKKLNSYSRYSLLSLLYEQMRQRCGVKSIYPMKLDEIIYRKIPKLAYTMLLEPYQKPIPSNNISNGFEFVATNLDFIFSKHIDAEGQSWFSFEHQDYRDFLAAMYFRNCVDDLRSLVPIQLSGFNFSALSDTTITMIIEAVNDFVISDEDFNGISKRKRIPDKINWWKKYEIVNLEFEKIQEYMNIGFEVGYYLADPLRHMYTNKNIYFEGYEKLISHYFTAIEYNSFGLFPFKSDEMGKGIVVKVLRKHIELLRRSKSFDEAFTCLNQLINWDRNPNLELLNQKAKLLMYKAQYSEKGADKDFIEGYELLKECANNGSIMSNNLLGRIYASPSPIVIKYLGEGIRDNKKGFLHFYNNVKLTQTKKCLAPYEKYSYVRCAKMLLHGNIGIRLASPTFEVDCLQSYDNFNRPEPLSIKYAEVFLKQANSNSAYALYLQGVVDYFRSALTSAISKFKIVIAKETHLGKILPSLFLYQILNEDGIYSAGIAPDGLLKLEDEIIKSIHILNGSLYDAQSTFDFELYHPQYILEDIRYVLKCLDRTDNAIRAKGVQL